MIVDLAAAIHRLRSRPGGRALGARLAQSVHDFGDLLAKKPGAAGRRVTGTMRIDTELFELCGSDFSQRDDLFARK